MSTSERRYKLAELHEQADKDYTRRWIPIALVVALGIVVTFGVLVAMLVPAVLSAREAARTAQCQNNLKQIGLALHNYLAGNGCFPPAYTVDDDGRPMHSWRALILPYLTGAPKGYSYSEPWDGPNNRKFLESVPNLYAAHYNCPSDAHSPSGMTSYFAVIGNDTLWPHERGRTLGEITDGLGHTIAVVEAVGMEVPWSKPVDIEFDTMPEFGSGKPGAISSNHGPRANFLMADGSVRTIADSISPQVLRALLTVDDGEEVQSSE